MANVKMQKPVGYRRWMLAGAITLATPLFLSTPALAEGAPDARQADAAHWERLFQKGRWFTDRSGRVVLLRGGNVSLPGATANGGPATPWSPQTPARMAEQGFNAVRLVIFLSELMPQPGHVDQSYLEHIADAVAAYKASGIRTLIDFHQDEFSATVGVRGFPAWAVFSDGHERLPGIEFPMGYFKDPAVQRAFDNFWANHIVPGTGRGVQDFYADALAAVAKRFRDEPAVIGIDVMNEPATGSRCSQPDPVSANCPELEQQLLRPFYEKASRAIAAAAPRMMIFVEPFMLQGALGTPINTPIVAPPGRRGYSYHNYGPVEAVRDKVNDGVLAHAIASDAAPLNTEWGFTNDPAEVAGQAADFDARILSWLAWPRGAFEALVDPSLPDRGNGDRVMVLRAYARPYPQATAGTPEALSVDAADGTMIYRYATRLPSGGAAGDALETRIAVPRINYPQGYTVEVSGAHLLSAANAPVLRLRNLPAAREVEVRLKRVGTLPPLQKGADASNLSEAALAALPPIPDAPLSRNALLGHIVATSGGRAVLDAQAPGLLTGVSQLHGWERMTLVQIQKLAGGALSDAKLAEIDAALAGLKVTPGPVRPHSADSRLGIDSLTSDLLADPRARAILEREAPGLINSPQQGLFPQTRLRNLQPAMPDILTDAVLARIAKALADLP